MKASDYIVEYLIEQGITDVFGYPGGMVTHLMDSFSKYQDRIRAYVTCHEQGAAFAACGYAQMSGKPGVAYATSGPGATNLLTGICNAYMDSIPTIFITGQVNSFEQRGSLKIRQCGFQETDIVSMLKPVTKFAARVNHAPKLRWFLEKAFCMAQEGRKGPVLLDIAMDVLRTEIDPEKLESYREKAIEPVDWEKIRESLKSPVGQAGRPVFLLGRGLALDKHLSDRINVSGIPVVTSMIAVDHGAELDHFYGFIGAYGGRTANFIIAKSDLVISLGARLDIRQVGADRKRFAPGAKIIRVDIDQEELEYRIHEDDICVCADAYIVAEEIVTCLDETGNDYHEWRNVCESIRVHLDGYDDKKWNEIIQRISGQQIPEDVIITTDVGQNQVWIAQSFKVKKNQRILFSGGHGAMGYSLPAAIGACIASGKSVYCFNGDGGFQMNLQELQVIAREKLPVKIFIFNNQALGMIRHFQEMYFDGNYFQTKQGDGYDTPDFGKLADAYGLRYRMIQEACQVSELGEWIHDRKPCVIEIRLEENTYVFPKLEYGKPNQDQEPPIDRKLYQELMALGEKDDMTKIIDKSRKAVWGGVNSYTISCRLEVA